MAKDEKDLLGDILGEELGEWDKMFDSLHEGEADQGNAEDFALPAEASASFHDAEQVAAERAAREDAEEAARAAAAVHEFDLGAPTAIATQPPVLETPSSSPFEVDSFTLGPSGGPGFADRDPSQDFKGTPQPHFLDVDSPAFNEASANLDDLEFAAGAEALGSLLGSGPIELPDGDDAPPSALTIRARQEAMSRSGPLGPDDAALDDVSTGVPFGSSAQALSRANESAAAFFEEAEQSGSTELTLELDDDFYDGIQIDGRRDTPTPIPPAGKGPPARGMAHTVRRDTAFEALVSQAHDESESEASEDFVVSEPTAVGPDPRRVEALLTESTAVGPDPSQVEALLTEQTSVRSMPVPREALRDDADEALDFDREAPDEELPLTPARKASSTRPAPVPSMGVPSPVAPSPVVPSGFGVLRSGNARPDSEDNLNLQVEVEGAFDHLQDDVSSFASPESGPATTVEAGVIRSLPPELDGVVEAAVEDAISLGTGTLNTHPNLRDADIEPDLPESKFPDEAPSLDLNAIQVPERVEIDLEDRTEEMANLLVLYERELLLLDEVGPSIRLRIEAGRLAETLGDLDKARMHLDEALKLDPRLVPANRALRRIERILGNWGEVLNQLEKELAKASPMEVRALASYRADLLIATGELDLARVAVGELLDGAPGDTRSLLANLELAFVDGRDDEFAATLDALGDALTDAALAAAVAGLQGALAERSGQLDVAAQRYGRAAQLKPGLGSALAQAAALTRDGRESEAVGALATMSAHLSPDIAAALRWQEAEQRISAGDLDSAREILDRATDAAPESLLLAQTMVRASGQDSQRVSQAWQSLAGLSEQPLWASQCLRRASHYAGADEVCGILERSLQVQPADRLQRDTLRRARLARGMLQDVHAADQLELDRQPEDALFVYRFAQSSLLLGQLESASSALQATLEKQADQEAAQILGLELAYASKDQQELGRLHALRASGATGIAQAESALRAGCRARTRTALLSSSGYAQAAEAWREYAESAETAASGAGLLSVTLATMADDDSMVEACARQASSRANSSEEATQLCVERAGRLLRSDAAAAADCFRDLSESTSSLRSAEVQWCALLACESWPEAVDVLEAEAQREAGSAESDRAIYRAAYLRVERDIDTEVAHTNLEALGNRRPGFAAAIDLLSGNAAPSASTSVSSSSRPLVEHDNLSAEIRRGEELARAGKADDAADLFATLLTANPNDPLIEYDYQRYSWQAGASAQLGETALAKMRHAEESGDSLAKADACAELARIDGELRGDFDSALMLWESASKAAPDNAMYQRILEREYGQRGSEQTRGEPMRLLTGRILGTLQAGRERCAYLCERAHLSVHLGRVEAEASADFVQAYEDDPGCREALLFLESQASAKGPSEELAQLEALTASYFSEDQRARAAFLVRSGETWRSLDRQEQALARFKAAVQIRPGFAPALFAWRDLALDHELWPELAEACLLEAANVETDEARAELYLLAGTCLMDKAEQGPQAVDALRKVLAVDATNREAFVRLRRLLSVQERYEDLAQLLSQRLAVETESLARCELHHALAKLLLDELQNAAEAMEHLRAVLAERPNDKVAVVAVSELCWRESKWAEAAEALMVRARLESEPAVLKDIFSRLGTIYSRHLPEPSWALKSFHKVVSIDPNDTVALQELASLGVKTGDFKLALGACEQLIKQDPPADEKISYLQRMAEIFLQGFNNPQQAERALRVALDLDPSSDQALDGLIAFYIGRNDMRSARIHVDRVASAMRARIASRPADTKGYRIIARAMQARVQAGSPESKPVAVAAASIAVLLGESQAKTLELAKTPIQPAWTELASSKHDDLLFSQAASGSVRALFSLLGDRLAKHAGMDVRNHGVGRSDRLRKGSDALATMILEQSADMGIEDVDIYVSKQKPRIIAAEPTSPPSLIFGSELVSIERAAELRFLVGRSLKLAASQLSVPVQLGVDAFGVLLVGILRQFQPEFAPPGVDPEAAAQEQQKLKRLIPSQMLQELAPFAMGLGTPQFDHKAIYAGIYEAANRCGAVCAGDAAASVRALMRIKELRDPAAAMQDAEIAALVRFLCSDDHGRLWAASRSGKS